MKRIKRTVTKILKVVFFIFVLFLIGYAAFSYFSKGEEVVRTIETTRDEFAVRVEQKMESSEGQKRLRNWAEQEVANEIIAEQEARLEELRADELGL